MNTIKEIYENWPLNKYLSIYLFSIFGCFLALKHLKRRKPDEDIWQIAPSWIIDGIILFPVINTGLAFIWIVFSIKRLLMKIFKIKPKPKTNDQSKT